MAMVFKVGPASCVRPYVEKAPYQDVLWRNFWLGFLFGGEGRRGKRSSFLLLRLGKIVQRAPDGRRVSIRCV